MSAEMVSGLTAYELSKLVVLTPPEPMADLFGLPLDLIWTGILFAMILLSCLLQGRFEADEAPPGFFGIATVLSLYLIWLGAVVFNTLLWHLFMALPDGMVKVREVTTMLLYGVGMVAVILALGAGAYQVGASMKNRAWAKEDEAEGVVRS